MKRIYALWILVLVLMLLPLAGIVHIRTQETNASVKPETPGQYDLIVVGAEPEGVVAAVAAARRGLKTLLLEERDGPGGLMIYGALNYLDLAAHNNQNVNGGLFAEWHRSVGSQPVIDIDKGQDAFLQMIEGEPNLTFLPQTRFKQALTSDDGSELNGIVTESKANGEQVFFGKRFIDSTEDADLAAQAGVPHTIGQEDIGRRTEMAVTLMIHLKHVDWDGIKKAFAAKKFGGGEINGNAAWGFWKITDAYRPQSPRARLRGLNIGRNSDGTIYINALQILGVDGLDAAQKREAYEIAKQETGHVLTFLRKEVPVAFEHAEIASYPQQLYVRETRHIQAEYNLQIEDVWENRDQWDSVGYGAYPVDIQATSAEKDDVVVIDPAQYAIPFRSLVPQKVDRLLVASRASGYSSLAAGSARTIPTGMTAGEAAGVAAALSIQHGIGFREMSRDPEMIEKLRGELKRGGALVEPFTLPYPYQGAWFYPQLKRLYQQGLIFAGYDNHLQEHQPMTEQEFARLYERLWKKGQGADPEGLKARIAVLKPTAAPLTGDKMALYAMAFAKQPLNSKEAWKIAVVNEWIDRELQARSPQKRALTRAEGYYQVVRLHDLMKERSH
ncbi:FAD-dependent oxidoreductase [Tumebacillus sp. DT12]|uniref:FAD-dependent oxidoreductase n=1 Tax=Tumebacillus lacus TaxID=2995335 RepID=A0ABT3X272_9BACL|nr:FAD-dependent oxidoreductase [Tumebacillus lacus]MCX7571010.1 FAD-dependent oxidoreductase [Tumebacillus lacus]